MHHVTSPAGIPFLSASSGVRQNEVGEDVKLLKPSHLPINAALPNAARPEYPKNMQILACFAFLSSIASICGAQVNFEENFDDLDKPWEEVAIQLPAVPVAENLLWFYVSPTATQTFAIDGKSLTIGADGVIRYTLVAGSATGAKNISYEGIRCQSYEKKLYAFGHQDGTWSRSRNNQWERIKSNAANRQHAALAQDYLCQGLTIAGKAEQMIARIRNKQALSQ